jgi:hypothetical protein
MRYAKNYDATAPGEANLIMTVEMRFATRSATIRDVNHKQAGCQRTVVMPSDHPSSQVRMTRWGGTRTPGHLSLAGWSLEDTNTFYLEHRGDGRFPKHPLRGPSPNWSSAGMMESVATIKPSRRRDGREGTSGAFRRVLWSMEVLAIPVLAGTSQVRSPRFALTVWVRSRIRRKAFL